MHLSAFGDARNGAVDHVIQVAGSASPPQDLAAVPTQNSNHYWRIIIFSYGTDPTTDISSPTGLVSAGPFVALIGCLLSCKPM